MFVAPDAPDACTASAFGRQWFSIPRFDGSTPEVAAAGLAASAGDLAAFLAARMQAEAVSADQVALVGFSQGTMMALHVAPRQSVALAGVVGFSGRLLQPERLVAEALTRPPVLLIHGDADPVVPYSDMAEAEAALDAAGFAVVTHTSQGLGHGISPDGLGLALQFLQDRLGQDRLEPT